MQFSALSNSTGVDDDIVTGKGSKERIVPQRGNGEREFCPTGAGGNFKVEPCFKIASDPLF